MFSPSGATAPVWNVVSWVEHLLEEHDRGNLRESKVAKLAERHLTRWRGEQDGLRPHERTAVAAAKARAALGERDVPPLITT
jgi:hypothetical protein